MMARPEAGGSGGQAAGGAGRRRHQGRGWLTSEDGHRSRPALLADVLLLPTPGRALATASGAVMREVDDLVAGGRRARELAQPLGRGRHEPPAPGAALDRRLDELVEDQLPQDRVELPLLPVLFALGTHRPLLVRTVVGRTRPAPGPTRSGASWSLRRDIAVIARARRAGNRATPTFFRRGVVARRSRRGAGGVPIADGGGRPAVSSPTGHLRRRGRGPGLAAPPGPAASAGPLAQPQRRVSPPVGGHVDAGVALGHVGQGLLVPVVVAGAREAEEVPL